jgi:hypothetical protein
MNDAAPLKPLHSDSCLSSSKLEQLNSLSTERLKATLAPGKTDCLKVRPDGTILDGHHRIYLLRKRGVDVDALPREVEVKRSF